MRSTEAIGKHWCLVFVAYSLLHLTCLPAVPDRTKGLIQTIGDACRQQGRALLQGSCCSSMTSCPMAPRLTMSLPSYLPSSEAWFLYDPV